MSSHNIYFHEEIRYQHFLVVKNFLMLSYAFMMTYIHVYLCVVHLQGHAHCIPHPLPIRVRQIHVDVLLVCLKSVESIRLIRAVKKRLYLCLSQACFRKKKLYLLKIFPI